MDKRTTFIAILSLAALYEAFANQCLYSTFAGMKTLQDSVLESFIVDHYYNDCEYLCYKNPSKCLAANLVPDENDTFRCEFISLNSTTKLILEPNPQGKHISRLSDDTYLQKFDDFKLCQSSTAGDQYPCEQAFDGRLDLAWMTTSSLNGEWIQVMFEEEHYVCAVEVWFNKITKGQCQEMSFRFVPAALLQVLQRKRDCVGGDGSRSLFMFSGITTNSVTLRCTEMCSPRGWLVVYEISFFEPFRIN